MGAIIRILLFRMTLSTVTLSQSTLSKRSDLSSATYSLRDFAKLLGISYTACHEAAQRDALPVKAIRLGRLYRFPKSAVHALLGIETAPDQAA